MIVNIIQGETIQGELNGAKKYNKKATAKDHYVTDLQSDLKTPGYLTGKPDGYYGQGTSRAIIRFQRHAKRLYRVKKDGTTDDVKTTSYKGTETGTCDKSTAAEIRNWVTKNWVLPPGRFKLVKVGGAKLRSDAAHKWTAAIVSIKAKGGAIITNDYGDSLRPPGFRKLTEAIACIAFIIQDVQWILTRISLVELNNVTMLLKKHQAQYIGEYIVRQPNRMALRE